MRETGVPSRDQVVADISKARELLGAGDKMGALAQISAALARLGG